MKNRRIVTSAVLVVVGVALNFGRAQVPGAKDSWKASADAVLAGDLNGVKTDVSLSSETPMFMPNFPNRPSAYVLLSGVSVGYELWNLKTGVKEKVLKGRAAMNMMLNDASLSPDGQFIVATHFGAGDQGLDIYSTRTDAVVGHISRKDSTPLVVLGFAGANRLAVFATEGARQIVRFHSVGGGAAVGEVALKAAVEPGSAALSANGKYLAVLAENTITMIDTTTAKVLGETKLPMDGGGDGRSGQASAGLTSSLMAFSPDGKELCMTALGFPAKLHVVILSATTGQLLADKQGTVPGGLALESRPNSRRRLTWSPDGAHLAIGLWVMDRAGLEFTNDYTPLVAGVTPLQLKWATGQSLIMFSQQGATVSTRADSLATSGVKPASGQGGRGAAVAGAATSRGGRGAPSTASSIGVATPVIAAEDLSAVTVAESAGVKSVGFDHVPAMTWKYAPATLPKEKEVIKSFTLSNLENKGAGERLDWSSFLFTDREANGVVVEQVARHMTNGPIMTRFERHDLATGAITARLDVDGETKGLDVSGSGKTLAVRSGLIQDVVRVFREAGGTYKLDKNLGVFRPFKASQKTWFNNGPSTIVWGGLVDDDHLLVLSFDHRLAMISIAAGARPKVEWTSQQSLNFQRIAGDVPVVPALSPNRKTAAVCTNEGVVLMDPLTGEVIGKLPVTGAGATAHRLAFSADGTRLAATDVVEQQSFLEVYDLKSGERVTHMPMREDRGRFGAGQDLCFLTSDYVMTGIGDVMSVSRGAEVWHYNVSAAHFGSTMPHEKYIFHMPGSQEILDSVALPHPSVLKAANKTDAELFIWHPGMDVKLNITVIGDEAYKNAQLAEWARRLKLAGITVDANSRNELRFRTFLIPTPDVKYNIRNEVVTVKIPVQGYDGALLVGGQEVWKDTVDKLPTMTMPPAAITIEVKPGETAQQGADRAYPQPKEASLIVLPPPFVLLPGTVWTSSITPGGVVDNPAK